MRGTGPSLASLTWPRRTERLVLRPATVEDTDAVHAYRSQPRVATFLSTGSPLDRAEVADWLMRGSERAEAGHPAPLLRLAVEHEGEVVGDCMVRLAADDNGMRMAELGYAIHPEHAGRGFATEVARELLRLCFTDLHVAMVTADVFTAHLASQRVVEKAGLRLVAEKPAGSEGGGRPRLDDRVYAVTAAEWAAHHP